MTDYYIIEKDDSFSRGRLEFYSPGDRMDNAIEITERDHVIPPEELTAQDDYDPGLPILRRADFDQYERVQKDYAELMALRGRLIDAGIDFDPVLDGCGLTGDNKKDITAELAALKAFADKKI